MEGGSGEANPVQVRAGPVNPRGTLKLTETGPFVIPGAGNIVSRTGSSGERLRESMLEIQ